MFHSYFCFFTTVFAMFHFTFFSSYFEIQRGGGVQPLKFPSVSTNGLNSKNYQLHKRKANTMLHSRSMWLVTLQKLLSTWAWPWLTCSGFSKEYNFLSFKQNLYIILQYIFSLKLFLSILPVQIFYCRFKILHQGKRFAKSCTVKPV